MVPSVQYPTLLREIAGVPAVELARQFGTPCYVYDAAKIQERMGDLAAFDVVRYAVKACSNLAILDLVRRHNALVDTVSAGEIRRALAAGYQASGDPPPIVFTADIFDHEALDLVVDHAIHANCGSPDMIDQLGARAPGREITLRINPGFGHGHSQKTNTGGEHSKHGIWHADLDACLRRAEQYRLRVTGLHMHIGSGADLNHLSQVAGAMEHVARQTGSSIRAISAGGGLPVPYRSGESLVDLTAYFQIWDQARRRLEKAFDHRVRLEIEPGRYVVAESGFLVTQIRAIKHMGATTYYLVDAGFNNLARCILYGAYHPMAVVPGDEHPDARPDQPVVVGGPLCESGDIFTQHEGGFVAPRSLPAAHVGELLIIQCAGAYGFVMGSNYCSRPMCPEVLIQNGHAHLIRSRQPFEDLVRSERIPDLLE
jgi:diaminopimelate decarboxylase